MVSRCIGIASRVYRKYPFQSRRTCLPDCRHCHRNHLSRLYLDTTRKAILQQISIERRNASVTMVWMGTHERGEINAKHWCCEWASSHGNAYASARIRTLDAGDYGNRVYCSANSNVVFHNSSDSKNLLTASIGCPSFSNFVNIRSNSSPRFWVNNLY